MSLYHYISLSFHEVDAHMSLYRYISLSFHGVHTVGTEKSVANIPLLNES
jgi:hypothetical protein